MATKTWARLVGGAVAELLTIDAELVPGRDIPSLWTDDVTAAVGVAIGWMKGESGTFAAPSVNLAALQFARWADLEGACATAITGGFASAALGSAHWYGSKTTDQANLDTDMMAAASVGPGVTADIVCSVDSGATWTVATHSAAQIGQLWSDFRAWRIACQAKKRTLQAAVTAAATPADIASVTWS